MEWPQGGERVRGKANIIAFRSTYPARQQFELHRITGCHELWVNEEPDASVRSHQPDGD